MTIQVVGFTVAANTSSDSLILHKFALASPIIRKITVMVQGVPGLATQVVGVRIRHNGVVVFPTPGEGLQNFVPFSGSNQIGISRDYEFNYVKNFDNSVGFVAEAFNTDNAVAVGVLMVFEVGPVDLNWMFDGLPALKDPLKEPFYKKR